MALTGTVSVVQISFPGSRETDLCSGDVADAFPYIWIPCLIFEAILCLLAVYTGVKHSKELSRRSIKSNRPQLMEILIHGNVLYFLRSVVFISFVLVGLWWRTVLSQCLSCLWYIRLIPRFSGWQMPFSSEHLLQFWLVVGLSFRSDEPLLYFSRTRHTSTLLSRRSFLETEVTSAIRSNKDSYLYRDPQTDSHAFGDEWRNKDIFLCSAEAVNASKFS